MFDKKNELNKNIVLTLIPLGIALNLSIGVIVTTLKLPVYLDAIGTIIVTLLLGWKMGVLTGVLSFLMGGLLTNPVLPYFSLTQAAIAIYVYLMAKKGWVSSTLKTLFVGIGLGIVAGIISAPVIIYLFGGITGSGTSMIAAFLIASGKGLIKSVVLSGFASEPVDKTLQIFLAIWILKGIPKNLLARFDNILLQRNNIIKK